MCWRWWLQSSQAFLFTFLSLEQTFLSMLCQKKISPFSGPMCWMILTALGTVNFRITINRSENHQKYIQNQPQGNVVLGPCLTVSCKVIIKSPFKKTTVSLPYNFDHQKKNHQHQRESLFRGITSECIFQNVPRKLQDFVLRRSFVNHSYCWFQPEIRRENQRLVPLRRKILANLRP